MAQVDKVQVQSTTYDIAQSSSATFAGTSSDTTSPSSWTDVDALASGETNGSIFTKISKMFSNIRWLYNQLGTTDYSSTGASTVSGALAALQGGKAASSHSHAVGQLPVSSTQVNSSDYIPTSSLIYSMNTTLTSLNDAFAYHIDVRLSEAWWACNGIGFFYYEGNGKTTYNAPSEYCFIFVSTRSSSRGIALAWDWRNGYDTHSYTNNLHNDSQGYAWTGWKNRGLRYGWDGTSLFLYDN